VGGDGSGLCPVVDFGNSSVEPSGSATREVIRKYRKPYEFNFMIIKCFYLCCANVIHFKKLCKYFITYMLHQIQVLL